MKKNYSERERKGEKHHHHLPKKFESIASPRIIYI